jgi:predicted Zn-dependent protease
MKKALPRALTCLLTAAIGLAASAQEDMRLPELGSSADALITPKEQDDYGAAMVREMRSLGMVLDDPLLETYVNDVGYRLVAGSAKPRQKYTFFIVKDDEINAFAAPGGYIAVNTGLITITRSESELAGVLAHEIGHITQNHLVRAFEESKKAVPLMALVLLGALAAGSTSRSGDALPAVLMGGQGLIVQKQINFTRKDETEADRTGIQTLANAGYDPNAMATFFERMGDTLRAGAGSPNESVPELLQSHPVTVTRISDAKARARVLVEQQAQRPAAATLNPSQWGTTTTPIAFVRDPTRLVARQRDDGNGDAGVYALMRERARVLAGDPGKLATLYAQDFSRPGYDTQANHYGYALALLRTGRAGQGQAQLKALLAADPANFTLRMGLAEALVAGGQRGEALPLYADLHAGSPRSRAVAIDYANALVTGGDKAAAARAAAMLKPLLDDVDEPEIYRAYARASEQAGDPVRGQEAYADAAYLSGRPFDAMEQLKRLLARSDLDYYQRSRINARIAELTPLVLELRKKRVQTEDNPDGRSQPLAGQREAGQACMGRLCLGAGGP